MHDRMVERTEQYLLALSLQLIRAGTDVILDWGLWTREQRERIRKFYQTHGGIQNEIHYLKVDPEMWNERIRKRNHQKDTSAYYVDDGLLEKVNRLFEEPAADEVDLILK